MVLIKNWFALKKLVQSSIFNCRCMEMASKEESCRVIRQLRSSKTSQKPLAGHQSFQNGSSPVLWSECRVELKLFRKFGMS